MQRAFITPSTMAPLLLGPRFGLFNVDDAFGGSSDLPAPLTHAAPLRFEASVRKDTLRVSRDASVPDRLRLSFKFDSDAPVEVRVFTCAVLGARRADDEALTRALLVKHASSGAARRVFSDCPASARDFVQEADDVIDTTLYSRAELTHVPASLRVAATAAAASGISRGAPTSTPPPPPPAHASPGGGALPRELCPIVIALTLLDGSTPAAPLTPPRVQLTLCTLQAPRDGEEGGEWAVRVLEQHVQIGKTVFALRGVLFGEGGGGSSGSGGGGGAPDDASSPERGGATTATATVDTADGSGLITGSECVICLSDPRDTAVLPCRHLCLCAACAQQLTFQTNRCPVCRGPCLSLLSIAAANESKVPAAS
jgi:hypothetical protein